MKKKISKEANKFGAADLICDSPWIVDPEREEDLDTLKKDLDVLVSSEYQESIPLSWFFLRNAFFKTGQLYIKTRKLKKYAEKCRITGDKFEEFLSRFTGFGSIIHIPDIPLLCNYVILNPPDFFHKLTELFYPRYNGDLQYGIASLSTLRRLFGEDLQFFRDVLTSCSFAVEIASNQIVPHDDEERRLPIAEPCLYIPGMRTEVASPEDNELRKDSLLLVYKKALLPTHITENVVKFLFQSKLGQLCDMLGLLLSLCQSLCFHHSQCVSHSCHHEISLLWTPVPREMMPLVVHQVVLTVPLLAVVLTVPLLAVVLTVPLLAVVLTVPLLAVVLTVPLLAVVLEHEVSASTF